MSLEMTPEIQSVIDAAVEAATTGLKANNIALKKDLDKARKAGEITPEQLAEVESERDKAQADLAKVQKDFKAATANAEKMQKQFETEAGFTQRLLIDNGLTAELTKHGVTNPVHLKAAQALLRGGVQVQVDGDNRTAKVGDKALADYVKEWAGGDEGKHFVSAPASSGGDAPGGGGKGTTKTMSRADYDAKARSGDPSLGAFFREGGTIQD